MKRQETRKGIGSGSGMMLIVGSLVILLAAILLLRPANPNQTDGGSSDHPIRFYCAAGIKPVINDAIAAYSEELGTPIEVQYGGSGTLLSQLEVRPDGVDLYLAADSSYLELAREKGLIRETLTLARLQPVVAVAKGNPKGIESVQSLLEADVQFGLANPDAAAVGKIARKALTASGQWDAVKKKCKVFKPTVNEIASDVALGSIDAAVIWDSTVAMFEELEAIELPEFAQSARTVTIGVTKNSEHSVAALRFARFLGSPEKGKPLFTQHGFQTIDGDRWDKSPELVLFAGSMFNQAIEDTVKTFEAREGVQVSRVYNGCGILVGQMRTGATPDAYFSCDQSFMEKVGEQFAPPTDVSENPLVLITAKSNPKEIQTLEDLAKPDLRVGLAHAEKSALGHLTQRLLEQTGALEKLKTSGNWKQDAPQGDFLVNALRTGALDAAVVYKSNAIPFTDADLEVLTIEHADAVARQPYAVARNSEFPATMNRLLNAIVSENSRATFEQLGFRWVANQHNE